MSDAPIDKKKITFKENKALYIKNIFKSIGKFIWNNKTKEFFGRDGESWMKLSAFYTVHLAVLGGFTWAMMAIFMAIANSNPTQPRYIGSESVLYSSVFSPGLGVRPHLGADVASIVFSVKDPRTYVTNLDLFLEPYNHTDATSDCSITPGKACIFNVFAYLDELGCSQADSYGYKNGTPCVLVKLNNVFSWVPSGVAYPTPDWFPSSNTTGSAANSTDYCLDIIKRDGNNSFIYVTCRGVSDEDRKNIKSIEYSTPLQDTDCAGGIPFYYYPFKNVPHYQQPLVPVKFDLERNKRVSVECIAWAKGLEVIKKQGFGYIKFDMEAQS